MLISPVNFNEIHPHLLSAFRCMDKMQDNFFSVSNIELPAGIEITSKVTRRRTDRLFSANKLRSFCTSMSEAYSNRPSLFFHGLYQLGKTFQMFLFRNSKLMQIVSSLL